MRYLPLSDDNRAAMRDAIGVADTSDLFCDVPAHVLLDHPVDLPFHQSEMAVERTLAKMASRNLGTSSVPSFLGAGAYRHPVPALVDHLIQRGEFLTSYTPYQPEVSQGTLQYLFEFQTQVALLTGMEVANASLYDGATAVAEAITMAARITRRRGALVSGGVHPHYRQVAETQARHLGIEFQMLPPVPGSAEDLIAALDDTTACVVVQNPGLFGEVCDYTALAAACHDKGALLVVAVPEVVSLGALMSPGEMGADIVVGEGQGLGGGLNFGGPYLGLMATRQKFIRQMPGRLAGETVDSEGRRGWVLTLSTREQHIRREKATSNICTNSGLISLAFTIHLSLLGEAGLGKLAALNHARACQTADRLAALPGVEVLNETFFNEFTVRLPKPAEQVVETLAQRGILAGVPLSRLYPEQPELASLLLVCATEANDEDDMDRLTDALQEALS